MGALVGERMTRTPRVEADLKKQFEPELGILAEFRHVGQAIGNLNI